MRYPCRKERDEGEASIDQARARCLKICENYLTPSMLAKPSPLLAGELAKAPLILCHPTLVGCPSVEATSSFDLSRALSAARLAKLYNIELA